MRTPERIENLMTYLALLVQAGYKKSDLIPPIPEDSQTVDWDPEQLAKLATSKTPSKKPQPDRKKRI